MQLTGGTRALTGTASTALASGLVVMLYGTIRQDLARAVGGTCLTLCALTVVALILIRRWIVDTREERLQLAAAQREAHAERSRHFAAQAAFEVEQGRVTRDRAAEKRADAARLIAERAAMAAQFEERRAALIAETMETTVLMIRGGKLAPDEPTHSKVIQFPQQQPQTERARSREHGVVGP